MARRFLISLAILVCLCLNINSQKASATSDSRACDTNDPPLSEEDARSPNVESGSATFQRSTLNFYRGGDVYTAELYGLGEAAPGASGPPYVICLRYEIKNTSNEVLQELRWPHVGLGNISQTIPGETVTVPRTMLHNSKDLGIAPTELFVFENSKSVGESVFPLERKFVRPYQALQTGVGIYSLSRRAFTGVDELIDSKNVLLDASQSIYPSDEGFIDLPELSSGLNANNISAYILSKAAFYKQDNYVESTVKVSVSTSSSSDAYVFAPGVASLVEAGFARESSINARILRYSEILSSVEGEAITYEFPIEYDVSYSVVEGRVDPVAFIVQQPIKIMFEKREVCLIAPIYSPVPVSLSDEAYCQSGG